MEGCVLQEQNERLPTNKKDYIMGKNISRIYSVTQLKSMTDLCMSYLWPTSHWAGTVYGGRTWHSIEKNQKQKCCRP